MPALLDAGWSVRVLTRSRHGLDGPAVARRRRGGRGRRHLTRRPRPGPRGRRGGLLPAALDGRAGRLRRARPHHGPGLRGRGGRRRHQPGRLPQRAAPGGRAVRAPGLPGRGRRDLPRRARCRPPSCRPGSCSATARRPSTCCATSPSGCPPWSRPSGSTTGSSRSPSTTSCTTSSGAADLPEESNRTFDIGGPEVLTYADMMQRYAEVAGLGRRLIVSVPVLSPRLAGLWVGLVTPISAGIARPLVGQPGPRGGLPRGRRAGRDRRPAGRAGRVRRGRPRRPAHRRPPALAADGPAHRGHRGGRRRRGLAAHRPEVTLVRLARQARLAAPAGRLPGRLDRPLRRGRPAHRRRVGGARRA